MSWDLWLFRGERVFQSVDELVECDGPGPRSPLGSQDAVRAAIDEVFPGTT